MPTLPRKILITHVKPRYQEVIGRELAELRHTGIAMLRDGDCFEF